MHVEGAHRLARISKEMGVERFLHVSALNADREHEVSTTHDTQFSCLFLGQTEMLSILYYSHLSTMCGMHHM